NCRTGCDNRTESRGIVEWFLVELPQRPSWSDGGNVLPDRCEPLPGALQWPVLEADPVQIQRRAHGDRRREGPRAAERQPSPRAHSGHVLVQRLGHRHAIRCGLLLRKGPGTVLADALLAVVPSWSRGVSRFSPLRRRAESGKIG